MQMALFDLPDGFTTLNEVNDLLEKRHYLGPIGRGWPWMDEFGALVIAAPTARNIPYEWLELSRWCLVGGENCGTKQWAKVRRYLVGHFPSATTVVSYSDPGHGHSGALYRACGWLWAPTWHRLRPPPTGNGDWGSGVQSVKDRWIYPLRRDTERAATLSIGDESIRRKMPWAEYREPRWKRGHWLPGSGGGDFLRFQQCSSSD